MKLWQYMPVLLEVGVQRVKKVASHHEVLMASSFTMAKFRKGGFRRFAAAIGARPLAIQGPEESIAAFWGAAVGSCGRLA